MTEVDGPTLRRIAGNFPTGVTVVTAVHDGRPCGLTVNSFASVSLDPPLILVCISRRSRAYRCLEAAGRFAVNVLADDQEGLARLFASLAEEKFAGLSYRRSPGGSPILDGVHAWLDCEVTERHPGGNTHTIFVARVTTLEAASGSPLAFYRGSYRPLGSAAAPS